MKTKFLVLSSVLVMSVIMFSSFKTENVNAIEIKSQDELVVKGTYDGHEDYGYNFIVLDSEGVEITLTFERVEQSVLDTFKLDSEDLTNKKFKITYKVSAETEIDDEGTKYDIDVNTIIKLEAL